MVRRGTGLVLVGLLLFTGCLPYSCRRQPSDALYPVDSLSRLVAQEAPVDTLQRVWATTGSDTHPLEHPRTVRFLDDGRLAVSDVERNSLFRFTADGQLTREVTDDAFEIPYLIGTRGDRRSPDPHRGDQRSPDSCRDDTLVVFNAGTNRIDFVVGNRRGAGRSVSYERPTPEALVYMLATDGALYAKTVGRKIGSAISRLDRKGEPVARVNLGGPYWRRAGFLRAWGDTLLSLSAYRPIVQWLPHDFSDGTTPDSMSLVGFDSPMLERSYAFAQGAVSKAPLLTPAAAPVGDTLFILNLRPGWVQIDAYGRNGHLQRRLVERHPSGNRNFYPLDFDAHRTSEGYVFAVTVRSPEPRLELFRWQPG